MAQSPATRTVIVGGCPRSGTRLVQDILDTHPDVTGGPEFDYLPDIARLWARMDAASRRGRTSFFYDADHLQDAFARLVADLLVRVATERGTPMVSEKTPDNVFVFPELARLLPDARFVLVVRDPRSIAASLLDVRHRAVETGQPLPVNARDFGTIATTPRRYGDAGDRAVASLGERLLVLHLEDLLQDPRTEIERLCAFVGLEFDEAMLNPEQATHARPSEQGTPWREPVDRPSPIDAGQIDRWRRTLSSRDAAIVLALARSPLYDRYRNPARTPLDRLIARHPAHALRIRRLVRRPDSTA